MPSSHEVKYSRIPTNQDDLTPLFLPLMDDAEPRLTARMEDQISLPSIGVNIEAFENGDKPANPSTFAFNPPPLRYPIETKTKSLALTWSIIIFTNTILPISIFYVLRHVFHSSTEFILNISQIPMTPTLFQFPYRLWQLKRRNGERSPRNSSRLTWDFFQWQFLFGALLTTAVCVVAGVMVSYKAFALAPPILFSEICLQLLVFDLLAGFNVRQPCQISSVPKGEPFRPAVYYLTEDLTAVDGGGGSEYRDRLAKRWEASLAFRYMMRDVSRILGFSGLLMVGIELAFILMTPVDVFFGASWVVLWTWVALCAYFCISYVKTCLIVERELWQETILEGQPVTTEVVS